MKNNWFMLLALASVFVTACFDGNKTAGGSTEDAGIIADLNVAGVTQKGPFVKGAAVTVQGIDCKTLKFTDEIFEGKVKSDKGDFTVEDVSLKSTCALFEVTGVYRNEITGKKSSEKLTLHALTDLKDRKNVNINVLTELEYERLMFLVTEKGKKFAEAKAQAEKEVLAAFDIKGDFVEFENLNIFESGDENAALLAVSVMMQAETDDAGLVKRMEKFVDSFVETGKWKDSGTKKTISEWAIEVTANGGLDSIRKNVEAWDLGDTVPAFEKFIEAYADGDSVVLIVTPKSSSSKNGDAGISAGMTSSSSSQDTTYNAEKNTLTDTRDGQVYRTVTIGDQVWMAENLNYKTDNSFCYDDSSKYCDKYGRLYIWDAAMNACPEGWRLPDETDFVNLIKAVGGEKDAGTKLKSTSGWNDDDGKSGNGTDSFGFSALPAGIGNAGIYGGEGYTTFFWGSTECSENSLQLGVECAYAINLDYDKVDVDLPSYAARNLVLSVRCVKGKSAASSSSSSAKSSSSSAKSSSSSADADGWSWNVPKDARLNPNIKYDSMVDPRDNQVYKIVKIEVPDSNYSQVWMAENLNYADSVKTPSLKGGNWCYQDNEKNCKVSGRYYSWAAAIDSVALANDSKEPLVCGYGKTCGLDRAVQGICPDGWHLPSIYEWGLLSVALGTAPVSGEPLKALTGWNYAGTPDNNGTDLYGFAALPTGRRISATSWEKVGSDVYYWSATEQNAYYGRYFNINNVYTNSYTYQDNKYYGQSVRCIKGDPSAAPVRPSSSSSVDETKSSSSVTSVSSSSVPEGYVDPSTVVTGTMTDTRDGQTYKTVKIGSQEWMAENLNYEIDSSFCYNDSATYCDKYGRLYRWATAVGKLESECGYGYVCSLPSGNIQGVCPSGWHMPSKTEWEMLFNAVGGQLTAGKMLKSTSGWSDEGNGEDEFGFSVLPSGYMSKGGAYDYAKTYTSLLSSTEFEDYDGIGAYVVTLNSHYDYVNLDYSNKSYGFSVRCVKD